MALMEWNDKLSVGVAELDNDHKKLVAMLNDLYDSIKAGRGKDKVGSILDGLVAYTATHFAREERFFAQTKYPATAEHMKEHAHLTAQVVAVQKKYKEGATSVVSLEVMNFLKNWLLSHIQGTDRKYGPHLNAGGIH